VSEPAVVPPDQSHLSNRRLARDTVIYGVGQILSRLASVVMLPVYINLLSTDDYGILYTLTMMLEAAGILLSEGTTAGLLRYFFRMEDEAHRRELVSSTFAMLVFLHLLGGILILAFAPFIHRALLHGSGAPTLVYIAGVNFILLSLLPVPLVLMQAEQRSALYSGMMISKVLCQLTTNIIFLVGFHMKADGMLLSVTVSNLLFGIPSVVWMLRRYGFRIRLAAVGPVRRFGVPYQIATAASFTLNFGSRFLVQGMRTLGEMGIYTVASQFGLLMTTICEIPFFTAWTPIVFQFAPAVGVPERDARLNEGFGFINVLTVTLALAIAVAAPPFLGLVAKPAYHEAAKLIPVFVLAYALNTWYLAFKLGVDLSERTKFVTIADWSAALAALGFSLLLIPRYGGLGAAWATTIGFAVRVLMIHFFSVRLYPVAWAVAQPARLFALALGIGTLHASLLPVPVLQQVGAGVLAFGAYAALAWWWLLTGQQKLRIGQFLARLRVLRRFGQPLGERNAT
jgi:O-antigen/teichoic acid export membrane protein